MATSAIIRIPTALWPEVPETCGKSVQYLTETQIDKVTHLNAMRLFKFDPFKHHKREELTVGALRAKAKAAKWTPLSSRSAALRRWPRVKSRAAGHFGRRRGNVRQARRSGLRRRLALGRCSG